mgnify:FL=1
MRPDLMRRVQRYGWDKAADVYERHWSAQLLPAQELLLRMADLQPGERVLDVAAGTGLATFPAAAAVGPSGEVVGTDISTRMVEAAALEAERRGLDHVRFVRTDAEALEVDGGPFDAALCALGLMYVPDPVAALARMREVTRPGGRVASAVWGARARCGWAEIFPIVDSRVESDVCPMFFALGTGDALRAAYEQAGMPDAVVERISITLEYADDSDAIGAAFAGGPVALAYSRFDDATRDEAHAEYLASIAAYRVGEGYRIPGEFVVAVARR